MKMYKKGIAWILALMLALGVAPGVFAAEEGNGDSVAQPYEVKNPSAIPIRENNAVYRNKTLSNLVQDNNGDVTGELTLETYVKGEVKTTGKPSDIVLVLDVSGSMDDVSYDAVYDGEIKTSETYYISTTDSKGNKQYREVSYRDGKWHQEYSKNTVVPKNGPDDSDTTHTQFYVKGSQKKIAALKNAVNGFIEETDTANSGIQNEADKNKISIVKFAGKKTKKNKIGNDFYTEWSYKYNYTQIVSDFTADSKTLKKDVSELSAGGATSADYGMELAADQLKNESRDSNKVVVFFTDGEPNHGSGFNGDVANTAIEKAKGLKANNTKIYSIGIFGNADPSDTKDSTNAYMNGVSSNYPNATSYKALGDAVANASYYKVAQNATDLKTIFEEISQEVNPTIALDEKTVVQDVMSGYFDVKGNKDDIKVYTSSCNGQDANEAYEAYTFDDKNMSPLKNADVKVNGDVVTVKGFDFSENAVAKVGDKEFKGKKLIIKIPVKIDKAAIDEMGGTWVPSNGLNSAVFPADSEMNFEFNSPEVYLPVIESTAILQAESGTWTYDGENHSKTAGVVDRYGNAVEGYTISYSTDGGKTWSQDVPTVKDVTTQNVLVKAERKGYTSLTGEFTLTVNKRPVVITANSASKVFGTLDPEFENAILELGGDDIDADKKAALIEADLKDVDLKVERDKNKDTDPNPEAVGTHENVLSITASAVELGEKYTNYVFTINPANFVITKSEALSINAMNVNEIYDGQYHAITDVKAYLGEKVTEDATIEFWDGLKWVGESPSLKNVGKTEVKVRATLEGYEDAECTATIEITKRPVTLTSESATKEYDGEALTRPDVETAGMGFVEEEVSNIHATGSITEVGEVKNDIAFDAGREFNEGNYEITYNYGVLKVTEKTVPPTDNKTTPTDNNGTADKTTQTGDDFQIWLIAGIALLALAGAGTVIFTRRRKAD